MKLKRSDMVILPVALLVASASIGVHGSAISRLDHAADNIKADKSRHQQLIDDYCNLDVSKLPHSPAHPRVQIVSGNGIDEPPVDPTNFRETFGSFGDVHPDPIDKDNPLVFGKRVRVAVLAKLPRNPALGYLLRPRGQVSLAMQSVVDHDVDSSESETSGSHQSTITCRPYALRMSTQTSTANTDNDFFVRGHGEKSTLEEIRCPKSKQRLLLAQFDFAMPDECLGAVQRYMLSVRYMVTRRALRWLATRRRQVVDAAIKSEPFTLSMRPIDPGFGVSGRYADAYARCSNYDRKNGRLVEPSIPENWLSATTFPFGYEDNTVEGRLRSGEDLRLRFFHFKAMTGMGYGIRATDVQVHELQGNEPSIDDPVVFEHSFLASDGYQCVLGEEEFGSQVVLGPLDVALVNPGATSVDDQHSAQCVFPPPTPSALMDHFEERNFAFTKGMSRLAGQVHAYRLDVPANVFSANRDRIGNDSAAPLYYISIHNHISEPDGNDPVSRYLTRPVVKAHNWRKAQHVTTGFFRVGWGF